MDGGWTAAVPVVPYATDQDGQSLGNQTSAPDICPPPDTCPPLTYDI